MPDRPDSVTATWSAERGGLVGVLAPAAVGRRINLMTISGPARSVLEIYRDYVPVLSSRITRISDAAARTWTADGSPIPIPANCAVTFIWTAGSTTVNSSATVSLQSEVY